MIRVLLRKQMMEVFSWLYQNKKTGKIRSIKGMVGYAFLYLVIFGFLGSMFYLLADMLCAPLVSVDLGWLYFAIMGLLAVFLGVFGSVFNTYASLYNAKDNDLLFSMPIRPGDILLARLSGVYAMGLMYELIVMIPAMIIWFFNADMRITSVIFTLLIPFVLSVLILILSAVLGWLVAVISVKLKHKNIMTVILSLAFIAIYYYCYGHGYLILQSILVDPQTYGKKVQSFLYPLYHMGLAAEGNVISMLIFASIAALLFAAVYLVLSHSFLRISITNRGSVKAVYKEQKTSVRSIHQALLQKEFLRFLGSANYMLNCGLGIVIMLVSAGVLLWKQTMIQELMTTIFSGYEDIFYLMTAGAVCLLSAMNIISAPSVSLEGKNVWLLQVFPVSGKQVLKAKLHLHLLLTMIPAAVLIAALEWVVKPAFGFAVLIPIVTALFILMDASFGLFMNLKMPILNWTNEIIPIKQSMSVMISLFGSWALVVAFAVGYYLLRNFFQPLIYLIFLSVLLLVVSMVLLAWLMTKGANIFEKL